jgi:hypothetical protein
VAAAMLLIMKHLKRMKLSESLQPDLLRVCKILLQTSLGLSNPAFLASSCAVRSAPFVPGSEMIHCNSTVSVLTLSTDAA